jgi:NDP-sugar pyrophosphorylase family protein
MPEHGKTALGVDAHKGKVSAGILAAGFGQRLQPLTSLLPKPMFPLGGKVPILELWIEKLVAAGLRSIAMNLFVLPDTIRNYFGKGGRFTSSLSYREESAPSGTLGGACRIFEGFKGTGFLPSGDIITAFDSSDIERLYVLHRSHGAAMSIVLVPVPWERRRDFGVALLEEDKDYSRITSFFEKDPNAPSNLNNASIYLIETDLLHTEVLPRLTRANPNLHAPFYDFGKHLFPALMGTLPYLDLRKYPLYGLKYTGHWFDLGSKKDYLQAQRDILKGGIDAGLPFERLPWGWLGYDVSIDFDDAEIHGPVIIGNRCRIEKGARLGPWAVIGDGWTIRRGAAITESVLWEDYGPVRGESVRMPQIVEKDVRIEKSIVAGGIVRESLKNGTLVWDAKAQAAELREIDWVPEGLRA